MVFSEMRSRRDLVKAGVIGLMLYLVAEITIDGFVAPRMRELSRLEDLQKNVGAVTKFFLFEASVRQIVYVLIASCLGYAFGIAGIVVWMVLVLARYVGLPVTRILYRGTELLPFITSTVFWARLIFYLTATVAGGLLGFHVRHRRGRGSSDAHICSGTRNSH